MARRMLIDTDPGTDDAIALLMALGCHLLEITAITTVGGNVPLYKGTRNALSILEYMERTTIPVASGYSRPIEGKFHYAYAFHGLSGLITHLPLPSTRRSSKNALEMMNEILSRSSRKVTLTALGPLTNIAGLIKLYPQVISRIEEIVIMGGAVGVPGNVTPYAEFNFYNDPLAADLVLSSGMSITLIDLGSCRKTFIDRESVTALHRGAGSRKLVGRILSSWFIRHPKVENYYLYDPLAMAIAIDPDIVETVECVIHVDTSDSFYRGRCRVQEEGCRVKVSKGVNTERFFQLFYDLIR